jgi:hypothetical protein
MKMLSQSSVQTVVSPIKSKVSKINTLISLDIILMFLSPTFGYFMFNYGIHWINGLDGLHRLLFNIGLLLIAVLTLWHPKMKKNDKTEKADMTFNAKAFEMDSRYFPVAILGLVVGMIMTATGHFFWSIVEFGVTLTAIMVGNYIYENDPSKVKRGK